MPSGLFPRRSLAPLVLSLGLSQLFGCSSKYEPESQFWENANDGGVGGTISTQGRGGETSALGGTQGSLAGSNNGSGGAVSGWGGASASSGGSEATGGRGDSAGGSSSGGSSSGGNSSGGSSAAGNSTGGNSSGGRPTSGGSPGTGGSASGGRTAGSGGSPGSGGASGAGSSTTCSLSVSVTTTAPGGQYQPRNVGAIWVANSSGAFVKSLDVWGNQRLSHVTAWNAATKAAGAAGNKVDAVTSATLSSHKTHNVTWNCQNYNRQPVPDGSYRVYFEVTDANKSGPNHFESFTKGPSPVTVKGSSTNFNNISLVFTP